MHLRRTPAPAVRLEHYKRLRDAVASTLGRVRYVNNCAFHEVLPDDLIGREEISRAHTTIKQWEGYKPTRLVSLKGLASRLAVTRLWLKDESPRFELGSFKVLGGAYAAARRVEDRRRALDAAAATTDDESVLTLACATDGNHGRAVAWGAGRLGCRCVIYIHSQVSEGRADALSDLGAEVIRVSGNYDDAVHQVASDAANFGWIVVADTSVDASEPSPRYVMAGYTLLISEVADELGPQEAPTHILVQAGVGGLAAATIVAARLAWPVDTPRIIIVEPERADCILRSIEAGERRTVAGSLSTVMAGLSCGEVSYVAWPILRAGVNDCLTVPDELVGPTMMLLADSVDGDPPLVIGESGVAGLCALILARADPALSDHLHISSDSRILVIGTEGATDPRIYRELLSQQSP